MVMVIVMMLTMMVVCVLRLGEPADWMSSPVMSGSTGSPCEEALAISSCKVTGAPTYASRAESDALTSPARTEAAAENNAMAVMDNSVWRILVVVFISFALGINNFRN